MRDVLALIGALMVGAMLGALPFIHYRWSAAHHPPGHAHGYAAAAVQPQSHAH